MQNADYEDKFYKADSLKNTDQLILVVTEKFNDSHACIVTYERSPEGTLKRNFAYKGFVGEKGLSKRKQEGDKKTPVGLFHLGHTFGTIPLSGIKMPFSTITGDDVWVDDPDSIYYNTWQKLSETKGLYNHWENMAIPEYVYGVVICYNTENVIPGAGSGIFLHYKESPTSGCVAMYRKDIHELIMWLEPQKNPMILIAAVSQINDVLEINTGRSHD